MSRSTELLGPVGAAYLHETATLGEPDVHARLRARTAELGNANMQISPEQGRLMGLLVQLLGARRAIEVGVFTGYSALCVAERLPADASPARVRRTLRALARGEGLSGLVVEVPTPAGVPAACARIVASRVGPRSWAFFSPTSSR